MIYRRFGKTELDLSVFTCGGMRYQFKWEDTALKDIPSENQKNLEACIHRALEVGINHIETARGYGSSERQLGVLLPQLNRKDFYFQTKVSPVENSQEFVDNFKDSLERLKLDYVDLFSLHGINNEEVLDWSLKPGGCLEAARKLQQEGLVRHVGFSTHGPTDVIVKAVCSDGFDYMNLHWYYIYQNNWPAVVEAAKRDMGVFIISPSDKGGKLYQPSPKIVELCKPLHPIIFNNIFCLSHPEVKTLSIGASRPTDFDLHVESLEYLDQAGELLPPIIERLENELRKVVGEDLVKPYEIGLPDWPETPGEVFIPFILWLRNMVLAYDLAEFGKMRYNMMENGGHWIPGQNASQFDEKKILEACKNSPICDRVPSLLREAHTLLGGEAQKRLSESK